MTEDLFAYARTSDPESSQQAAEGVPTAELMLKVEEALRHYPYFGKTSEEVAEHLCINLQSITPRFSPLERMGRIYRKPVGVSDKGRIQYETRPGRSGRGRVVWFVKDAPHD